MQLIMYAIHASLHSKINRLINIKMEKKLPISFTVEVKSYAIKLYGILMQIHLSLGSMINTKKIFGPVFILCVRLAN